MGNRLAGLWCVLKTPVSPFMERSGAVGEVYAHTRLDFQNQFLHLPWLLKSARNKTNYVGCIWFPGRNSQIVFLVNLWRVGLGRLAR